MVAKSLLDRSAESCSIIRSTEKSRAGKRSRQQDKNRSIGAAVFKQLFEFLPVGVFAA